MLGQQIIPPRLSALDRQDELDAIEAELEALSGAIEFEETRGRCTESLLDFFIESWPEIDKAPLKISWHHEAIAEHLEAVKNEEITKLLINMPPRCGKTSLVTVSFPAWLWAQEEIDFLSGPECSFLCTSYGEDPVLRQANSARTLLMGKWYQRHWGDRVRITKDGLDELRNDRGGYRISASLSGAVLGSGANLRICDDPHNTEKVESDTERERTVRLFSEGLTTRRTDPKKSAIVVVMQRLHDGDVSGYVLENDFEYTHLMIPMRYEERRFIPSKIYSDPRTEEGELLWPEQFPEEVVAADERIMGPYSFSGQYQQAPVPRGGGVINRLWWKLWPNDSPEFAERSTVCQCACGWISPYPGDQPVVTCPKCYGPAYRRVIFPEFSHRVLSIDTNYGENEEDAWSAMTVWGLWHGKDETPRLMLIFAWRGRPRLRTDPDNPREKGLVERAHELAARHRVDSILIEQKTRGVDIYNELEKETKEWPFQLHYFNPTGRGDKVARLNSTVPIYTNGMIWAPDKTWAEMVISEVCLAPRAKFWDLTDTVTQTILWLRHDMGMLQLPDEHKREQIQERLAAARKQMVSGVVAEIDT